VTLTDDQAAGYSTKEMVVLSGLSFRQLDWYDRMEVLQPSLSQANGSGTRRCYSVIDLRIAEVLTRLNQLLPGRAARLDMLRVVAAQLRAAEHWPTALLIDRDDNGQPYVTPVDISGLPPAGVFVRLDGEDDQ